MSVSTQLTALLLLLQADSALFLWATNLWGSLSQTIFVLFLVIDLVGFSMISYTYRKERNGEHPGRLWMATGSCILIILFFSTLVFQ